MSESRSSSGHDLTPIRGEARDALAARLSPEARRILLSHGTEPPFCGGLLNEKGAGIYACALCALPLFDASAKFESGSGWPSFHSPVDSAHIAEYADASHGMLRIEIRCRRCDGHLGHVFPDGPLPTGLRYCLNSAALAFVPA